MRQGHCWGMSLLAFENRAIVTFLIRTDAQIPLLPEVARFLPPLIEVRLACFGTGVFEQPVCWFEGQATAFWPTTEDGETNARFARDRFIGIAQPGDEQWGDGDVSGASERPHRRASHFHARVDRQFFQSIHLSDQFFGAVELHGFDHGCLNRFHFGVARFLQLRQQAIDGTLQLPCGGLSFFNLHGIELVR